MPSSGQTTIRFLKPRLHHTAKQILLQDPEMVIKFTNLADQRNGKLKLLVYFKYGIEHCHAKR
jgi:hypothetical protein